MSARTSSSISSHVDPQTRFAGYFGVGEILRHHGERDEAIRIKRRMLDDLPAVSDRPLYGRDLGPWNRRCSPTWPTWSSTSASSAPHESHAQQALAIREQDGHPWGIAHALNALVAIAASRGDFPEARALQERVVTLMRDSQLIPAETAQEELALAELEAPCVLSRRWPASGLRPSTSPKSCASAISPQPPRHYASSRCAWRRAELSRRRHS